MTSTPTLSDLYKQLGDIADTGDEQAFRTFLTDHFNEFPEEIQKKIMFEFFSEALTAKVQNISQNAQIQQEGIEAIKEVEKAEKLLTDQQRLADLKSSLGM
jgi:ferritin